MKSEFLNTILNDNYQVLTIDREDYNYKYYKRASEELEEHNIKSYSLEEMINIIKSSKDFPLFKDSLNSIREELLYSSFGHGIFHNERSAMLAFTIATLEEINSDDIKLLLEAVKYHDIGRINDYKDDNHGRRSANLINFLIKDYDNEDINILKAIITGHSVDDTKFNDIAKEYNIIDYDRCKRLYNILKDADGLDRIRLSNPYVGLHYLRTETSKKLVLASYEQYNNFKKIYNNSSVKARKIQ